MFLIVSLFSFQVQSRRLIMGRAGCFPRENREFGRWEPLILLRVRRGPLKRGQVRLKGRGIAGGMENYDRRTSARVAHLRPAAGY